MSVSGITAAHIAGAFGNALPVSVG